MNDDSQHLKTLASKWIAMCQTAGLPTDADETALGIMLKIADAAGQIKKAQSAGARPAPAGRTTYFVSDPEGPWHGGQVPAHYPGAFRVCIEPDGRGLCDCGEWRLMRCCRHVDAVLGVTDTYRDDLRRCLGD